MTDQRLLNAFTLLDRSETPDAAFADQLFAALSTELGFAAGDAVGRPVRAAVRVPLTERVARRLGIWPMPVGQQALRLAWAVALVGLLLAMALGAALVASRLLAPPTPPELVNLSRDAWARAPAVQFTVSDSQGLTTVTGDGHGTWRSTSWDMTPGSYMLYDGERTGYFDADRQTWNVTPFENGGGPYPFNNVFAWTDQVFPDLIARAVVVPCDGATDLGRAVVAGRAADHIACPNLQMEYWLDHETHITLKMLARQETKYWMGPAGSDTVVEVTAFSPIQPEPRLFAWTGPETARPADAPLASSLLAVGTKPPAWSGTTAAGKPFSTDSLSGPAAVLFVRPSAGQRMGVALDAFVTAAARHAGVAPVVVGSDATGTVVAYLAQHRAPFDPVADPDVGFYQAWGITTTPALVLVSGDGVIAGMAAGRLTGPDIEAMLGALASARPIPTAAAAAPGPTPDLVHPTPGPGITCTLTTCLPSGATVPAWSGRLLAGGTLRSSELAGRPAVIWFCNDCGMLQTALLALGHVAADVGSRASFAIVSSGEATPGETARALKEAKLTLPVVFDLDMTVSHAFNQVNYGFVILDAQGRITAQPVEDPVEPQIRAALAALLPSPSPSASPSPATPSPSPSR